MAAPRLRAWDRNQVEMIAESLDGLLPDDHQVRLLWDYVSRMDLSGLYTAIGSRQGGGGAPAYDPRILLCLWLYATIEAVGSARELEQLCRECLPYRWICSGDVPCYHVLSDFRSGQGELLDLLMSESLAVLVSEGLVEPREMVVAHDGLRVRASAGRSSFRRRPTLEAAHREAAERVRQLKAQVTNEPQSERRRAAQERSAREREARTAKALAKLEELEGKRRRKDRQAPRASTTDPEAMRMKMPNGGIDPGYNMQFTTDSRTRLITAVTVANCGSDYGELVPALKDHERRLGVVPNRVLADAGFLSLEDIRAIEESGCEAFLPWEKPLPKRPNVRHPLVGRWRLRMQEEEARHLYKTVRPATAEWTNAQIRNRGLYRLTVRGKAKALTIALWHALAHNILQAIRLRELATQPA